MIVMIIFNFFRLYINDYDFDFIICWLFFFMYSFGGIICVYKELFGFGSGLIWLSNLGCCGDELLLFDCWLGGWGVYNCGYYEDVGV